MARFIAASGNIALTPTAKLLNFFLTKLTPHFENLWTETTREAHEIDPTVPIMTNSWVCSNSIEIADIFRRLNSELTPEEREQVDIQTYDFSTLYTTLPQDDICRVFDWLFDRIFSGLEDGVAGPPKFTHLAYNKSSSVDNAFLVNGTIPPRLPKSAPKFHYISLSDLKKLFHFLIINTYVKVGDRIYRQSVGIPMGTNPAVKIANYYLFYWD